MMIDSDFILFAMKDDKPIGVAVVLPDFNELFAEMNGRFLSKGFFRFIKYLWTKKANIKRLRILILGVLPDFDHTGASSALYLKIIETCRQKGYKGGEMSWILEDNLKMNKAAEMLGGKRYKTYRLYHILFNK